MTVRTFAPDDVGGLSGATILVIDDEPVVRDVVTEILVLAGAEVLAARDGAAALAAASQAADAIDVVLLDVLLPDMAADEVLAHLRTLAPSAAVLIITGAGDEAVARLETAWPVAAVLHKPFSLEALVRAVATQLGARSAG